MRTYEGSFVFDVLQKLCDMRISADDYAGGQRGGVPDIFYDTSMSIGLVKTKRSLKGLVEQGEKVNAETIELRYLRLFGLYTDKESIRRNLEYIRKSIVEANKEFDSLLREYIAAKEQLDIDFVCKKTSVLLHERLQNGCNSPRDWFFVRRFGIYG